MLCPIDAVEQGCVVVAAAERSIDQKWQQLQQ